jgi:hypothetical protein
MRAIRITGLTVLLGALVLAAFYLQPRNIEIDTRAGTASDLQVSVLGEFSAVATTDSRGIATFGRGPWSPLWGKRKPVAIKVVRDGKTLFDKIALEPPRWGALEISIP